MPLFGTAFPLQTAALQWRPLLLAAGAAAAAASLCFLFRRSAGRQRAPEDGGEQPLRGEPLSPEPAAEPEPTSPDVGPSAPSQPLAVLSPGAPATPASDVGPALPPECPPAGSPEALEAFTADTEATSPAGPSSASPEALAPSAPEAEASSLPPSPSVSTSSVSWSSDDVGSQPFYAESTSPSGDGDTACTQPSVAASVEAPAYAEPVFAPEGGLIAAHELPAAAPCQDPLSGLSPHAVPGSLQILAGVIQCAPLAILTEAGQVPSLANYCAMNGTPNFGLRLTALRQAFSVLLSDLQGLNYVAMTGRLMLGQLASLNGRDLAGFHAVYDQLVYYSVNSAFPELISVELAQIGIHQFNFVDVVFELALFGMLGGERPPFVPIPGSFLHYLETLLVLLSPDPALRSPWAFILLKTEAMLLLNDMFAEEENMYVDQQLLVPALWNHLEKHFAQMFEGLETVIANTLPS